MTLPFFLPEPTWGNFERVFIGCGSRLASKLWDGPFETQPIWKGSAPYHAERLECVGDLLVGAKISISFVDKWFGNYC